jgi:hypothetical protein
MKGFLSFLIAAQTTRHELHELTRKRGTQRIQSVQNGNSTAEHAKYAESFKGSVEL